MAVQVQAADDDVNAVRLRGKVSGEPERRVLPSGDEIVALRLVVRRHRTTTVDVVDVSVGPGPGAGARPGPDQVGRRTLAAAARLAPGDRVEVAGQLRRRWWDAAGARRSRIEVRASAVATLAVDGGDPIPTS